MPELPEVETVRAGLEQLIVGAQISKVEVGGKKLRFPTPPELAERIRGQRIEAVLRRAKFLLIQTSQWTVLSHLGMTGSWRLASSGQEQLHDHCYIYLKDGRRLAYNDPRRFGFLDLVKKGDEKENLWLATLGPEPFDEHLFDGQYLWQKSRGRKVAVKNFIMDQKVVVGVGNIYASEALFLAGVRPGRSVQSLTRTEMEKIVPAIRKVLRRAIEAGGTTIRDFRQAGGQMGYFQKKLMVYGRDRQACRQCQQLIRVKSIGNRSSYWCSHCQR